MLKIFLDLLTCLKFQEMHVRIRCHGLILNQFEWQILTFAPSKAGCAK